MDLDGIGFHTLRSERAESLADSLKTGKSILVRQGTIILTKACNLDCSYCNSKERKGKTFNYEELESIVTDWKMHGCEFIHFTGGEATLLSCLPDIVNYASSRGIKTSLTSNGTAQPELYQELIASGMVNMRISLDFNSDIADHYSGKKGAFEKTVKSINAIAEKKGQAFNLTINTCVWKDNLPLLPEIIRDFIALGVDDIKLMPVRQWRDELAAECKEEYERKILPEVIKLLPDGKYPLLRFRLPKLLTDTVSGFSSARMPKRCYLMLEERCIDHESYYPCFIYYQESGEPIGSISEPIKEQKTKIISFALRQSVKNKICMRNCADATNLFNCYVEDLLEK